MEREDIIGGLKSALASGESLNRATMTFINAGYKREEVETAAKSLNTHRLQPVVNINPKETKPVKRIPRIEPPKTIQKVSNYEQNQKRFDVVIMIVLVFILITLVGALIGVISFKESIAGVINKIF